MSSIDVPLQNGGFGRTARKDNWWVEPLLVFLGFSRLHRLFDLGGAAERHYDTLARICRRFIRRC